VTLTQEDLDRYVISKIEYERITEDINYRIGEILKLILKSFGKKKKVCWYWPSTHIGHGKIDLRYGYIKWIVVGCNAKDISNNYNDYYDSFPKEFLTMSDDEILDYIKNEINRSKNSRAKRIFKEDFQER